MTSDFDLDTTGRLTPPRVTLLIRNQKLRKKLLRALSDTNIQVDEGAETPLRRSRGETSGPDLIVVLDESPDDHARKILRQVLGTDESPSVVVLSDGASPIEQAEFAVKGASAVLSADVSTREIGRSVVDLARAAAMEHGGAEQPWFADFVTRSPSMQALMELARRVSRSESTVLISGETGVGKERLARAIHAEGGRRRGPFVAVNAGAIPEALLESELFGHVRGAFTGAVETRRGCFAQAARGTIFLDEIGEMTPHLQVKLLQVLQDRAFRPVGSEAIIRADVRVIAATNRDLDEAVTEGRFRKDLRYRLDVVSLVLPPLRERCEDIPQLAGRLLRRLGRTTGRPDVTGLDAEALARLVAHPWPGNVRELMNVLERSLLLAEGPLVTVADLPDTLGTGRGPAEARSVRSIEDAAENWIDRPLPVVREEILERVERAYLSALLRSTGGRVGEVAERAGISPRSLYDKIARLGLRKEDFRS